MRVSISAPLATLSTGMDKSTQKGAVWTTRLQPSGFELVPRPCACGHSAPEHGQGFLRLGCRPRRPLVAAMEAWGSLADPRSSRVGTRPMCAVFPGFGHDSVCVKAFSPWLPPGSRICAPAIAGAPGPVDRGGLRDPAHPPISGVRSCGPNPDRIASRHPTH